MKDSVTLIQADLEKAVAAHNEAVARLYTPSGAPYYALEVMREQGGKARQTLTAALDALSNGRPQSERRPRPRPTRRGMTPTHG